MNNETIMINSYINWYKVEKGIRWNGCEWNGSENECVDIHFLNPFIQVNTHTCPCAYNV